jgi:restriction endonuclease S subunit
MKKNKKVILKKLGKIFLSPLVKTSEEGNIKIVKPSSITNGKIIEEKLDTGKSNKNLEKIFLKKGDIIFQAKGNKFEAILIENEYENLISSQMYFNFSLNKDIVDPIYLCWYLNNRISKQYFNMNSSGAIVKAINRKVLENLEIILPTLEKQKEISQLVSKFYMEKEKTFDYLEKKELLINEKIINSIKEEA